MERKCENCVYFNCDQGKYDRCMNPQVKQTFIDNARSYYGDCGRMGKFWERKPQTKNFNFAENPPPLEYWK
jgi:hypothetical protein